MWKLFALFGMLVSSSAFAAGGLAECSGYTSKKTAYAFCLAYNGNKLRCSSLDEPMESWCEGVARLSTSPCSSSSLTAHAQSVCRALVNDTYSRCTRDMDRSNTEDQAAAAFCTALVKKEDGYCSRTGRMATECRMIVQAREDMVAGDASAMVTKEVDLETLRHLRQADQAIKEARSHIPDGAGNQSAEVESSNGKATARMLVGRDRFAGNILDSAINAAYSGGANCPEFAALTYAALVKQGVSKPVLAGGLKNLDHAFTLIGDPRTDPDAIVVDAWVSSPQAVRWADSCWRVFVFGQGLMLQL